MIKLIDILLENVDRDIQDVNRDIQVLDILLSKWVNYASAYDTLPEIEKIAKKLKLNTPPKGGIVYRIVPMVEEDIKDYPPEEIIRIDKENKIVSTTTDKKMIPYFSKGAEWAYVITYKPHVILNFDELERKYNWTSDVGEGEILIDASKSQVVNIKRIF